MLHSNQAQKADLLTVIFYESSERNALHTNFEWRMEMEKKTICGVLRRVAYLPFLYLVGVS